MKLYIEKLFIPNTSNLCKPKQETQHIIVCEEGIIYHEKIDQKLISHELQPNTLNKTHIICNIKLIEDNTKTSLTPIYNIPLNHHMFTLNREIYIIQNIQFIIEFYNETLYNLYFDQCNLVKDRELIEYTLKLVQTKS